MNAQLLRDRTYVRLTLDELTPVTVNEVFRMINAMSCKSSPVDYIHVLTKLLKLCAKTLLPIIAQLANLLSKEGCFPTSLKHAQVTRILKKPGLDDNDASNYWPISNLSTISKVFERFCLQQLTARTSDHPNFSSQQSAYRSKHSTLLKVTDDLHDIMDKSSTVVLVALGLSAAFDMILQDSLLSRLHSDFGVSGVALQWIKSYLY